jgi:hypothetical protein
LRQIKLSPFGQENVRKETIDGSISALPMPRDHRIFSIRAHEIAHNIAGNRFRPLPVTVIHGRHPTANVADTASLAHYPAGGRAPRFGHAGFIDYPSFNS